MKKIFMLILALICLTACSNEPVKDDNIKDDTVSKLPVISFDVTYRYRDSQDPIEPRISLNPTEKKYAFSYSGFSSHMPIGDYEIVDDKLYLWEDDSKKEAYVFDVTEEGYVFDAEASLGIPTYKVSGDSNERYSPVPDGALFERDTSKNYGVTEYGGYVKRVGSDEKVKMSKEDADAVSNIIFDAEWQEGVTDCIFDAQIDVNGFIVKYHSSCGALCRIIPSYVSHSLPGSYSFVLNDEDQASLNSVIEKYIELGEDIVFE